MTEAVRFDHVGFTFADALEPTLVDVDLAIDEGEFVLVVGPTGCGKSTLLRAVSGLVPRFSGGFLTGSVSVCGRRTQDHPPRDLADVVGTVAQDPTESFVADTVADEIVFVMENLAVAPDTMRRRLEDTLDLLDLAGLRDRSPFELSGGQQQRVAIASVLAANPAVLVLDEPTSALDPAAADDVLSALQRLVHDLGLTVLVAEHRLERVVQFADRVLQMSGPGVAPSIGSPRAKLRSPAPRPPVVRLAEELGWPSVPLTVREARRMSVDVRAALSEQSPALHAPSIEGGSDRAPGDPSGETPRLEVRGLWDSWGNVPALRGIDLDVRSAEIVAVMGRNGAGKSTLLSCIGGARTAAAGTVRVNGNEPHRMPPGELVRQVGLVPQDFNVLLFADSVAEECEASDHDADVAPGTTLSLVRQLGETIDSQVHPRDLSEGQRLAVAISVVMATSPTVLCLDEPTRGLDYRAKQHLGERLAELRAGGTTVVLASHDVELVAELAERVVVMADGRIVDDGPTRRVVCHSPVFSPQVSRVFSPQEWLSVSEVARAVAGIDST